MTSPASANTGASAGRVLRFVLAAIPWVAVLVVTPFVNRVEPFVLGKPFLLLWVVLCVVATSVCMAIVYVSDPRNRAGTEPGETAEADRTEVSR
jgi:predicted ABC-type exoprotein transport system permease subunit